MDVNIKCKTEGFDEAIEEVEALAEAYDSFPPQVQIRNCRDCTINVYPSQTKIIDSRSDYQEGYEDGYDQACMDTADDDLGSDCPWK